MLVVDGEVVAVLTVRNPRPVDIVFGGDLTREADPRHLAVALLAAHQGGTMLTFATASADPFRIVVNAAVDYVGTFRPVPRKRTHRSASRPNSSS